jgi:pimeloyl-ACP methyl ester carboxylesterase
MPLRRDPHGAGGKLTSKRGGGMARRFGWMLLRMAAYLLLTLGALALLQDYLIYYPDNPPRDALLAEARGADLAPWPDRDVFRGLLREPPGPVRGTLVLFHGNAGHAGHRALYADRFAAFGLRVLLAEYPGYGSRSGSVGETALVADAVETLALARQRFPGPLLVAGESIGAGVAAAAVGKTPGSAEALLLITPWDSLEQVARHHYPRLPVGWLLKDRYDSAANLAAYRGRVAVVIAENDSIVPASRGTALFDTLIASKRLWRIAQADHNDWPARVDAGWWNGLAGFLLEARPAP